jgi:cupin superfamily acireductone dioxygenase involved in methionine salvage
LENVNDITMAFSEDGEDVIEELDKIIVQKGVWAVILFRYQEKNRKTGEFMAPKASLRRYQKYKGEYRKRDAVNISKDSAQTLITVLGKWLEEGLLGDSEGES